MSEWLIHCTGNLKSGTYYASVDIHDGEQPVMILFRKNGEKNFVVGQGKTVNSHGRLINADALKISTAVPIDGKLYRYVHIDNINAAPTIIERDEGE